MATFVETVDEHRINLNQARVLSLDIPTTTTPVHSQPPSSIADSEPPSPSPLAGSDTLIPSSSATSSEMHSHTSSSVLASTSSLPVPIRSNSLGSSGGALNVRFAPLPELAPRKRRSAVPLGMAARGQLMRQRRGMYADNPNHPAANQEQPNGDGSPVMSPAYAVSNPLWTDEEVEYQRRRLEVLAARHAQYQASAAALDARHEEEAEEAREREREEKARMREERAREKEKAKELRAGGDKDGDEGGRGRGRGHRTEGSQELDPKLGTLSRLVKGAGKTLWRRVSNKELAVEEAEKRDRPDEKKRQSTNGPASLVSPVVPPKPKPQVPLRPILATIPSNGQAQRAPAPSQEAHSDEAQEPHLDEENDDSDLDRRHSDDVEDDHDDHADEEGSVWEEDIDDMFKNVGQTETIVEGDGGRVVYSKVEISAANGNANGSGQGAKRDSSAPSTPTSEIGGGGEGDRGDKGGRSLVKSLTSRTASPSLPIVNGKAIKS